VPDPVELTSAEAAARLGVKRETLYAYVSRGVLTRRTGPDGRSSRFVAAEVDRVAAGRRSPRRPGELATELRTSLTSTTGHRLVYRGYDAVALADHERFESVATLLWTGALDPTARFAAAPATVQAVRAAAATLPPTATPADRLRLAVAVGAPHDPLRFDLRPEAVAGTGARLVATLVDALPRRGAPADGPIAQRLWSRLTAAPADPALVEVLDDALVLLADHDLAASTFAARVAATVRADPWSVVAAGLAAHAGRLHGGVSGPVHRLLGRVAQGADPADEVADLLRADGVVPGFGHPLYPDGDPRATALLARLRAAVAPGVLDPVDRVLVLVGERVPTPANVDLALAALALAAGFVPGAGEVVFAVARTAGWIAHSVEEYGEPPLRLRPRALYVGPPPR